ncbi:hypothetical protein BKA67DRAFT_542864, partial [Truncatella angustata]
MGQRDRPAWSAWFLSHHALVLTPAILLGPESLSWISSPWSFACFPGSSLAPHWGLSPGDPPKSSFGNLSRRWLHRQCSIRATTLPFLAPRSTLLSL